MDNTQTLEISVPALRATRDAAIAALHGSAPGSDAARALAAQITRLDEQIARAEQQTLPFCW